MDHEKRVSTARIAELWSVSPHYIWKMCRRKDNPLPHEKFGGYKFLVSEVTRWARGENLVKKATVRSAPEPGSVKKRRRLDMAPMMEVR